MYRIESVMFKRSKSSNEEPGILLNEGTFGIVDSEGKIPKRVWNFRATSDFSMLVDWFFKRSNKK